MTAAKSYDKEVLFVLSIDTEEEWDWSGPFPQHNFEVSNITKLSSFQQMCDEIGIKPTYFIDYAVADNEVAAQIIRSFSADNRCEIGAHLHPWCNPPFFGHIGEKESHVINLPIEQVDQKLSTLVRKIEEQFGCTPQAFRTGRWGIDAKVLQLLVKHGFKLDSSIYPFYQNSFFSCQGAPTTPYKPDLTDPLKTGDQDRIFEIPVTAGFNRNNFALSETFYRIFSHPAIRWSRLVGIAWHTQLLRKIYLSPELFEMDEMLSLCRVALRKEYPILHMFMHSSSLIDNKNSQVGKRYAYEYISNSVKKVVSQLQKEADIKFCTISEAAEILQKRGYF